MRCLVLALIVALSWQTPSPAQYPYWPGYGYRAGFTVTGRNFVFSVGRSYYAAPIYVPYYRSVTVVYSPPPIVVTPPIIINQIVEAPPADVPIDDNGDRFIRIEPKRGKPEEALRPLPGEKAGDFRPLRPEERERAKDEIPPGPQNPMPRKAEPEIPLEPADNPRDEHARLIALGKQAFRQRQYGLAERRFERATQVLPRQAMGWFLLAEARFARSQYREALAAIETGMKLRAEWPLVAFQPRQYYGDNANDFEQYLRKLRGLIESRPNDPVLLFLYAYELWFDGRKQEARRFFQQAEKLADEKTYIQRFLRALPGLPIARAAQSD
ncbi:MAG: hypothetical protein KatS3mg105_2650 [Gemmatales bacterium]|nr:MAG: hypothetical protein KatS3mg105_2650 [Gemmatales bacterium]